MGDYHSEPVRVLRSPEPRSRRRITRRLPTGWRRWRATWSGVVVNVSDIENAARQNRLIAQAFQLFVLCFSVITTLIAVASGISTRWRADHPAHARSSPRCVPSAWATRAFAWNAGYECAELRPARSFGDRAGGRRSGLFRAVCSNVHGVRRPRVHAAIGTTWLSPRNIIIGRRAGAQRGLRAPLATPPPTSVGGSTGSDAI